MTNKEFDEVIKSILSQNTTKPVESDWDDFAEILKKSEGFQDLDFDAQIRQKVNNHTAPYQENHWQLLKNRLVKEDLVKKQIFKTKSIEAIVLLLLLFCFQQYDILTNKHSFIQTTPTVRNEVKEKFDQKVKAIKQNTSIKVKISTLPSEVPVVMNQSIHGRNNANHIAEVAVLENKKSMSLSLPKVSSLFSNLFNPIIETSTATVQNKIDEASSSRTTSNAYPVINRGDIEKMKSDSLATLLASNVKHTKSVEAPINLSLAISKKKEYYLTPVVYSGVGITKTDYDPIYKLNSYSTISSQYGGGILFSVKDRKLELMTGLKYMKRTHTPAAITEKYGDILNDYYQTSLNKISYDIAEIPMNIKYVINDKKKTKLYVQAGFNANLSLKNTYDISEQKLSYSNKPAGLAFVTSADVTSSPLNSVDNLFRTDTKNSRLKQKEFNSGLLQGGRLKDNYFFTLTAGMGIERALNDKNAINIGAEYNKYYNIDGIGPNKDKLNGVSMSVGVKHKL
jgi:hypothetical protein